MPDRPKGHESRTSLGVTPEVCKEGDMTGYARELFEMFTRRSVSRRGHVVEDFTHSEDVLDKSFGRLRSLIERLSTTRAGFTPAEHAIDARYDDLQSGNIVLPYSEVSTIEMAQKTPPNILVQQGEFVYDVGRGYKVIEVLHLMSNYDTNNQKKTSKIVDTRVRIVAPDGRYIDLNKLLPHTSALAPGFLLRPRKGVDALDLRHYERDIVMSTEKKHSDFSLHRVSSDVVGFVGYDNLQAAGSAFKLMHEIGHAWSHAYKIDIGGDLYLQILSLFRNVKQGHDTEGVGKESKIEVVGEDHWMRRTEGYVCLSIKTIYGKYACAHAPSVFAAVRARRLEEDAVNAQALKITLLLSKFGFELEPTMNRLEIADLARTALTSYDDWFKGITLAHYDPTTGKFIL